MNQFIERRFFSISSSRKTLVELFYDIASPYTYIQNELLKRQLPQWKSMQLKLTPVSIAHIMRESSNQPPAMVPAKGQYMGRDLCMISEYHRIPFAIPDIFYKTTFEIGTLKTQRFMMAILKNSPESSTVHDHLVDLFYKRYFTKENPSNIADVEVLKQLATESGYISSDLIEKVTKDMNNDDVKLMLKRNTDRAIEMGGFGLPMTMVHRPQDKRPKWVFGSDRMHIIGYLLGEQKPPILR